MVFPGEMLVDYVRVYQRRDAINVGCDPKDYPTKKYIDDHLQAYSGAYFVFTHAVGGGRKSGSADVIIH